MYQYFRGSWLCSLAVSSSANILEGGNTADTKAQLYGNLLDLSLITLVNIYS